MIGSEESVDLVYILGVGHSGSTLLDMLLGTHPDIFSLGEMAFFDDWVANNKLCACGQLIWECVFWREVLQRFANDEEVDKDLPQHFPTDVRRSQAGGRVEQARYLAWLGSYRLLGHRAPTSLLPHRLTERASQAHRLYDIIRDVSGKSILVDSSKGFNRMVSLYTLRPPSTRVVYLTRDIRGWLYSQRKRQVKYGPMTVAQTAQIWVKAYRSARFVLKLLPPNVSFHLRYEEIARQPEIALRRFCQWIGISFKSEMLDFRAQPHHNIGGNPMRLRADRTIIEDIRWRQVLSAEDLQILDSIAGKLNREALAEWYIP